MQFAVCQPYASIAPDRFSYAAAWASPTAADYTDCRPGERTLAATYAMGVTICCQRLAQNCASFQMHRSLQ
jgi:hypothetical protein